MAKILLVEDDPNIRMAAEFALSDAGHSIVACDNGTDGFASALSIEPDLILLDLMLPGMSGHDFLKEYRAQNASVPIIVLTAYTSEQEKVLCLDLGADDFISKPFSVNELLARIRANLRRSMLPVQSRTGSVEALISREARCALKGSLFHCEIESSRFFRFLRAIEGVLSRVMN